MKTTYEPGNKYGPFSPDDPKSFTWKVESYFLSLCSDEPMQKHRAVSAALDAVRENCPEWMESGRLTIKVFNAKQELVSTTTFGDES